MTIITKQLKFDWMYLIKWYKYFSDLWYLKLKFGNKSQCISTDNVIDDLESVDGCSILSYLNIFGLILMLTNLFIILIVCIDFKCLFKSLNITKKFVNKSIHLNINGNNTRLVLLNTNFMLVIEKKPSI